MLLHESQLVRYFQVSKAKFGLLTNGITYRFYTELEQPNIMDNAPFFEFNITELKENQIEHLRKFNKKSFNFEAIIETTQELKYLGLFKETIKSEFENPSPELVKHFLNKINYSKVKTEDRLTKYTKLLKSSLDSYIAERVNNNLRRAMENETDKSNAGVVTTDEEIEGYKIVKAILSVKIPAENVIYKDSKSYFSVNYDSTLKPVCRLYFNGTRKQIGLFDKGLLSEIDNRKIDDKYEITSLEDIYKRATQLLATCDLYDNDGFAKAVKSESKNEDLADNMVQL